jgi:hypothetical protein
MSQRSPDINSPQFGQQTCAPIVGLVLAHLPLGIDGRKIDDRLAWDILCYASVKRISIESACVELADAPSGNTTREHLDAALDPSRDGMRELESQLNQALKAQLPKRVCRRIEKLRIEAAADLIEIAYHGQVAQDDDEVRRGAAKSGTTHFHMYATLAVVHSGQRFTLAMTFVWAGETMDVVLARLIKLARELGVRFKRLYCDQGFCSVAVLRLLRQRRVPYLIPIPARGGAGGIKSLFYGQCSYYTRYTFKRGTREAYTTEVVVVCQYSAGRYRRRGVKYFAYAVYGLGADRGASTLGVVPAALRDRDALPAIASGEGAHQFAQSGLAAVAGRAGAVDRQPLGAAAPDVGDDDPLRGTRTRSRPDA